MIHNDHYTQCNDLRIDLTIREQLRADTDHEEHYVSSTCIRTS